jgi:hypothetical protein
MLSRVISYFDTDISYLFLISFSDVTWHSMSKFWVSKERDNVISAFAQRSSILFEIKIQSCSVLCDFNKEYFIGRFSRTMWGGIAICILTKWEMADNLFGCCWNVEGLYADIEITFDQNVFFWLLLHIIQIYKIYIHHND